MTKKTYPDFFESLTGYPPYSWQARFAEWDGEDIAAIKVFTGLGKELGAIVPWLYLHEIGSPKATTRLIYALPTRSLVDQVYRNTCDLIKRSGLPIKVYCLKGGKVERGFEEDLTQLAILIGTQDQLLSRGLNRGFGVSWGQRPLHFAAITNDCRWILDEIQLTGVAYSTLARLYRLCRDLETFGKMQLCLMSATFDDRPLRELELKFQYFELDDADFDNETLAKKVHRPKPIASVEVIKIEDIAAFIRRKYSPDQLSLIVVNTVAKAREIGDLLADLNPLVIHSRFLGFHRRGQQERLYTHKGIVIATQVVEAGVNLDADLLITELCPWSSFVQRCGRCGRNRTDNPVQIYWLNYQNNWKAKPYKNEDCEYTYHQLLNLTDASLSKLDEVPSPDINFDRYSLTQKDIESFFCTHPIKRKTRYSISQYVRDSKSFTVSVVWSDAPPKRMPFQDFVCPVPTSELKKFCEENEITPLVWSEDEWTHKPKLEHGDVVWLSLSDGGYSDKIGWTGNSIDKPEAYSLQTEKEEIDRPYKHNLALGTHLKDTEYFLRKKFAPHLRKLDISESLIDELCRCARWHDWGKAHPIWQSFAQRKDGLLAKSKNYGNPAAMNGYRHELASAFAAETQGVSFLSQYLIAAHHGKVRDSLLPPRTEDCNPKILRGLETGTRIDGFEIEGVEMLPTVTLTFPKNKEIIWFRGVRKLLKEYGVFKLVYLESLIRNADIEASKFRQEEARNGDNDSD